MEDNHMAKKKRNPIAGLPFVKDRGPDFEYKPGGPLLRDFWNVEPKGDLKANTNLGVEYAHLRAGNAAPIPAANRIDTS
jgi:hypothetical protein